MNGYDQSIADLIRTTIHDAQDLVRGEIALAKTELRQELRRVGLAAAALTSAAVAAIIAFVFLLTAVATSMPAGFGWAVWTGFAIVGGVMILVAITLGLMGRNRLSAERRMPLTTETMKENVQWTQARKP